MTDTKELVLCIPGMWRMYLDELTTEEDKMFFPNMFCTYHVLDENNNSPIILCRLAQKCKFFEPSTGKSYYTIFNDEEFNILMYGYIPLSQYNNVTNNDINDINDAISSFSYQYNTIGYCIYKKVDFKNKWRTKLCFDYTFFIHKDYLMEISDERKCELLIFVQQYQDCMKIKNSNTVSTLDSDKCNIEKNTCSPKGCNNSKNIYNYIINNLNT